MKKFTSIRTFATSLVIVFLVLAGCAWLGNATHAQGRRGSRSQSQNNLKTGAETSGLTGNYVATTGSSAVHASGGASGVGRRGTTKPGSGAASGSNLKINITRFATPDEYQAIVNSDNVAAAINGKNCGTVTIGSAPAIPVNLATAVQASNGQYAIYLLSVKPFSATGQQGNTASGDAVGFIEMRMDGSAGQGSLYTTTQVTVQSDGAVVARGGASTATQLAVEKQVSGSGRDDIQVESTTTPTAPASSTPAAGSTGTGKDQIEAQKAKRAKKP